MSGYINPENPYEVIEQDLLILNASFSSDECSINHEMDLNMDLLDLSDDELGGKEREVVCAKCGIMMMGMRAMI